MRECRHIEFFKRIGFGTAGYADCPWCIDRPSEPKKLWEVMRDVAFSYAKELGYKSVDEKRSNEVIQNMAKTAISHVLEIVESVHTPGMATPFGLSEGINYCKSELIKKLKEEGEL